MFCRKLKALDYHSKSEAINLQNLPELKALVVWLEDQKIRFYKIEERENLRKSRGANWSATFKQYLSDLDCPYSAEQNLKAAVDWLLGVAIRYEYTDQAERDPSLKSGMRRAGPGTGADLREMAASGNAACTGVNGGGATAGAQSFSSPLGMDPSDKVFVSGLNALAKTIHVVPHPDPAVLLEAVRMVIEEKLSQDSLDAAKKASEAPAWEKKASNKQFKVSPRDCGFDLGDPVLSEAAKVLRLLHLRELRDLQTNINQLIVAVQAITANPKTDTSLGKVGR